MKAVDATCECFADDPCLESEHLCMFYSSQEESRITSAAFIREGVERSERVIYCSPSATLLIAECLRENGLNAADLASGGSLRFASPSDFFLPKVQFEPEATIELLISETERALEDGFCGLRMVSDMIWLRQSPPGSERVIEFEARLTAILRSRRCTLLCQYDRRSFGPAVLLHLLTFHPKILLGARVYRNRFFGVFPSSLEQEPAGTTLSRWLAALRSDAGEGIAGLMKGL